MAHHQPPSDLTAYIVMALVAGGVLLGKFLMFSDKGQEDIKDLAKEVEEEIEKDIQIIEETIEEAIEGKK